MADLLDPKTSRVEWLAMHGLLPEFLSTLTDEQKLVLGHDWGFLARGEQKIPPGDWLGWMIMAGRGFGKTRVLAETTREWKNHFRRITFIGATADDVNAIFVEGESGIMACCPNAERPQWIKNHRMLIFPNGSRVSLISAEEPDRLRGRQHEKLLMDEVAAWGASKGNASRVTQHADAEAAQYAYDMAMLGLRLGKKPQVVIATTPRPLPLLSKLVENPRFVVTRGSTMDNRANLSPTFMEVVVSAYEGTRLGRQEIYGELLKDFVGSLWPATSLEDIVAPAPSDLARVVVAVDPSGSQSAKSDEIGIVVAGVTRGLKPRYFVLADGTFLGSPDQWARRVISLSETYGADRIVAEVNFGGKMVESVLRAVDRNIPFRAVTASRGKVQRAEPVAALYEQGKVSHVQQFPALLKQMEQMTITGYKGAGSPDRVDALVWAISDLMGIPAPPRFIPAPGDRANYWKGPEA